MQDLRLAYVNVQVADLGRSVAFFRDAIGLPLAFSNVAHGYASFNTPGAGFALAQAPQGEIKGRHTGIGFMTEDLDAALAALAAKGVSFTRPPAREPWGGYMAVFADPDGNTYYLDQIDPQHG